MNIKIDNDNTTALIVFLMGFIGLVGVIVFDKLYWGMDLLAEGWPESSVGYIIRSIIISIFTT